MPTKLGEIIMCQSGPSWAFKAIKEDGQLFQGSMIGSKESVEQALIEQYGCAKVLEIRDYYEKSWELHDKIRSKITQMDGSLSCGKYNELYSAALDVIRLIDKGE